MKKEPKPYCEKNEKNPELMQKRRGLFRKALVATLACFMFCLPLFAGCGTLSQGGSAASPAPSGPLGDIAPKQPPSVLGLDPETDKTIFTTESGLEIKFGGANLSSGPLSGYAYFTMGSYNGYAVNWVIIARHSANKAGFGPNITEQILRNFLNSSGETSLSGYLETQTPAGSAIYNDAHNGEFVFQEVLTFSDVPTLDTFLSANEVYCISECALFEAQFQTSSSALPKYEGSNLQSVCQNLPTTLGLTPSQTSVVVEKSIWARYTGSSSAIDIQTSNQSFYPPAIRSAADCISGASKLLSENQMLCIAYQLGTKTPKQYWTRDGGASGAISIDVNGSYDGMWNTVVTGYQYLRPCCVISLA